ERIRRLEYELFEQVRDTVGARAEALGQTARAVGRLDVLAALAEVAHARGHVRPVVDDGPTLQVVDGRHPVLESRADRPVTPNDVRPRGLVLLDEVGRGTSTYDGLAIAWAVVEALHDRGGGAKVLFATHYHELTQLAERLPRVRNFHVAVREWNDEIVFLHK